MKKLIYFIKRVRIFLLVNIVWRKYKIGKHFHCGIRVRLWAKNKIEIGEYCFIGRDSEIAADCVIGNWVMFGNKCAIVGRYDHNYQEVGVPIRHASEIRDSDYDWKGLNQLTIIGDDVWIGYGSTILSGTKINDGSIVAAGSVVTKDVEPYCIYAGVPARKIKNRFETIEDLEKHLLICKGNK